jgi:hypothetical protein
MREHCPGKRAEFGWEKGWPSHRYKKKTRSELLHVLVPFSGFRLSQASASIHSRATVLPKEAPKRKAKIGKPESGNGLGSENGVGFLLMVHHLRYPVQ